ncbi:MAG: hypothetical protein NT121_03440 [Chloroflexi bacterium]|nr:hypothetical protein [Chloroflexota bacterium]
MTTFHMETETVRAMASQLKQAADDLCTQGMTLNSSAQTVDWMGPSHDEFVNEVNGILRQLDGQAGNGTALAKRVEDEVTEWEAMARQLGGGSVGTTNPNKPSPANQARQKIQEKWDGMNFDDRKNWMAEWYRKLCGKLGIPPVEFKVEDLPDPEDGDYKGVYKNGIIFGLFRSITIDIDNVNGKDPFAILDTIAHETQHEYQHFLVENPDKRPNNISEEQIKSWGENFANYKRAEDDFEAYRNQPVESDARQAGERAVADYVDSGKEVM